MTIPFIDIHTHKIPSSECGDEVNSGTHIRIINKDFSDEINDNHNLFYSIGVHPWNSINIVNDEQFINRCIFTIKEKLTCQRIVFIGESGLDILRGADISLQRKLFIKQIHLSESTYRPLIIHCVKAFNDLIEIHKSTRAKQPWILHGYRNKNEQAKQLIQNGIQLSFGPRFNEASMQVAWQERKMWLETDDSSSTIEEVYEKASECLGVSVDEIKKDIYERAIILLKGNDLFQK